MSKRALAATGIVIAIGAVVAIVALGRRRPVVEESVSVPVPAADVPAAPAVPPAPAAAAPSPSRPPGPAPVAAPAPSEATNDARSRALHDAIAGTTPEAARLYAELARAGQPTPPEARKLVEMKAAGATPEALVAYVRSSFPRNVLMRAVALRWLGLGAAAGRVPLSPATPAAPFGTLAPADGG
jgi:hypothetical protein